jgi:hypothetical protein
LQAEASFPDRTITLSTYAVLARVSPGYPPLPGRLPTCYSPVRRSPEAEASFAHDLHVLSTPPAFILSQDQTLQFRPLQPAAPANGATSLLFGIDFQAPSPPPEGNGPSRSQAADFTLPLSSFQRTGLRPHRFRGEAKSRAGWLTCQPPASSSLPSDRPDVGHRGGASGGKRLQPGGRRVYSSPAPNPPISPSKISVSSTAQGG